VRIAWRFLEKKISALREVTAIQENNSKRINTQKLFEDYKVYEENLSLNSGDLRINRGYIYNQVNDVFEDITVIDLAIDRCGTLYLVDQVQNLYKLHANEKILEKIGSTAKTFSLALNTISAIGVDKDTIYIADYVSKDSNKQTKTDAVRLIALTKNDLQIRWILSTCPDGRSLNKIHTIQCDNRGKIYILEGSEKRILYINTGDVCYPAFHPFDLTFKLENEDFKPQDLAVGVDGTLYVLFVNAKDYENTVSEIKGYVLKVRSTEKEISVEMIGPEISDFSPSGIAIDAWNQIFIGESKTNVPLPIRKLSNDSYDSTEAWQQLTTYKLTNETSIGVSRKLISDSKGNLYVINDRDELTLLDRKELNLKGVNGYEGIYISKPIDSQTSKTRWHRLLLEGDFETGTQVDFQYYVSEDKLSNDKIMKLSSRDWFNCVSKSSAIQGNKKRDALFIDNIQGRYLWFKIILSGNEILSPVVKSVTIFFTRVSYLDYLPGIYQENSVSKGLLDRFLAIFESIFYDIDFTIDHISRYFDTYKTPPEFLSWLGSWLDVSIDEDWPEDKKRLFIRNAVSMYKKRGTREGLELSIELFTGQKPFIVEIFQAFNECTGNISQSCINEKAISEPAQERIFFPPNDLLVKDCLENKDARDDIEEELLINTLYGTERFSFHVLLANPDLDATAQSRIRRIIDEQKPAHTSYELKVLEPFFNLDMHTYLEINTVVTEPKFVVEKTSVIGRDTVLYDEERAGQIERHSRVGVDILLS
jgi:phage tail-like protein